MLIQKKSSWVVFLLLLMVFCSFVASSFATELPQGLVAYLKQKDPKVKLRFDGLILMSNGETYLPVLPQGIDANQEPTRVVMQQPPNVKTPDVIAFDNDLYLLRLIPAESGKLTLPRLSEYPLALKNGLLPQDLILPSALSIPVELRAILGSLPYDAPDGLAEDASNQPPALAETFTTPKANELEETLYVSNFLKQEILGLKALEKPSLQNNPAWLITLDCVPSDLSVTGDGKTLYATCLSTNELLVIDTQANLIKTRIPVVERPSHISLLPNLPLAVVSSRLSKKISVISTQQNLKVLDLKLPSTVGTMVTRKSLPVAYLTDNSSGKIYEVEFQRNQLLRTLNSKGKQPYLKNITSMVLEEPPLPVQDPAVIKAFIDSKDTKAPLPEETQIKSLGTLWVASRGQNKWQGIDVLSEKVIWEGALPEGAKPAAFAMVETPSGEGQLYLLCSGSATLEGIDLITHRRLPAIALPPGSFPTALTVEPNGNVAYISTANQETLYRLDLKTLRDEHATPKQLAQAIEPLSSTPLKGTALTLFAPSLQGQAQTVVAEAVAAKVKIGEPINPAASEVEPTLEPTPEVAPALTPEADPTAKPATETETDSPAELTDQTVPETAPKRHWALWRFAGRAPK